MVSVFICHPFTTWAKVGSLVLIVACAVAGAFRLLLPVRQAGLLVVRSRLTDVVCYVGLAVAITTLGLALPA